MEESTHGKCTPIGVFWDIENCCVPKWRSALWVVQKIRTELFQGYREVEFMCVCDTSKESKVVVQELNSAQVNVVHIDAISKNAADDKLRQNIRRFADIYSPPATIVLISSDVNFSSDLSDLRHRRKFDIVLIHKEHTHDSLIVCANKHILYEDLIKDIPPRTPSKPLDGQAELKVTGFSSQTAPKPLKSKIQQLANNTGGKVVSVTVDYVLVRFSSATVAERARKRMDGEDVYGSKIRVQFSIPGQDSGGSGSQNWSNTGRKGTPPRETINSKRNNGSPRQYQSGNNPATSYQGAIRNIEPLVSANVCIDRGTSPIQNLLTNSLDTREGTTDQGLQDVVKKFSQDKKSSRQMLMLQQQIYQEEQTPICDLPNHSTQFYSQYTKTSYTSSYYVNQQPWQPYGGCYQEKYQQKGYNNGYKSYSGVGYQNGYRSDQGCCYGNHNSNQQGFCPIRTPSPTESIHSVSPCDPEYENEYPGATELLVSNLDYNISPREWKHILLTTFHPHVKILCITVNLQPDNTSLAFIKVGSVEEARFAISQFHRKKIGYKRIHVTLRNDETLRTPTSVRNEVVALLLEAKGNILPLFKFIELYDKRYNKTISVSELHKISDTIEIREQGGAGRMVYLLPSSERTPSPEEGTDTEVKEILLQSVCSQHCPEGSPMYAEAINSCMLPNVKLQLKTFAAQVHSLLMSHDGEIPLMTFPACYCAEVAPLVWVLEGGVPLEHLISCVPGIQIIISKNGVKKVSWAENKPPVTIEFGQHCSSPLLNQQLNQLSRELVDLLKVSPNCCLPLSKFIPSYHHHFGRQCRVADYGYTKLMELFEALPHVVQVLGTGDRRVLTLTQRAQVKRFSADLVRLMKASPGKKFFLSNLTDEFSKLMGRPWDIVEYGVCCIEDMLAEIPATTITVLTEGGETVIGLPKKEQTEEETEKTKQFCLEVVDLLKHSHQYHMMFNKFIPSYHHHFGRQCRVSEYGFTKLQDLFDAIPQVVEVVDEGDEKYIMLTDLELRKVVGEQIVDLLKQKKVQCFPLDSLMLTFTLQYGFMIPLHDLKVATMEEMMTKLKHVLKVEMYEGKSYVVLADRSSAPPLARQVLQLLMDQSGGSLPWMELCSRYKTTFGVDPDLHKIKEELLDYVQVSGDDESSVISLTPLQTLARDIRVLLQVHGKVSLSQFEQLFLEQFGTDIKPALYGFPTTVALLMTIPHVVTIKGKGYRRMVHLSGDLQSSLPIIDESFTRPDSDTPSNDSGSALTDDDLPPSEHRKFSPCDLMTSDLRKSPCGLLTSEARKFLPSDLLSGAVPSGVPSPNLVPEKFGNNTDLMKFETPRDCRDEMFSLTEEERRQQMTPLCRTPTSELLQLAAQFLPSSVEPSKEDKTNIQADSSSKPLDTLKTGWWTASPSQIKQVSKNIQNTSVENEKSKNSSQLKQQEMSHDLASDIARAKESALTEAQVPHQEMNPVKYNKNQDENNNKSGNESMELGKEKQESEKVNKSNKHNPVKVNSLAALIEHIKMETAKSKSAQNTAVSKAEIDKKMEAKEKQAEEKQGRNTPPTDEPIARCPTPLQPGSYWYSKQFSQAAEKELPSTSSQEVRNVLATLTTQAHDKKSETSRPIESESQMKPGEISIEESSESSQSYSTDTLTETSDDKQNTADSTLEEMQPAFKYDSKDIEKEVTHQQENVDKSNNSKDVIEVNEPFANDTVEDGVEKSNKIDTDSESYDKLKLINDSSDKAGMVADHIEIRPNEFIKEEAEAVVEAELDDQLTEISPSEFIKNDSEEKQTRHSSDDCISSECMCYEAIFRQDHPLETSSLKSDTSFGTDSPSASPRKQRNKRHSSHSTSSLSDGSLHSPSRPSPRRCRIAAKFEQPLN